MSSSRTLIEHNEFYNTAQGGGGNGFNSLGNGPSDMQFIFWLRNYNEEGPNPARDGHHESFTGDSGSGATLKFGSVTNVRADGVTFDVGSWDGGNNFDWHSASVVVTSGPGAGQQRKVLNYDIPGLAFSVHKAFSPQIDTSSVILIKPNRGNWIIAGNTWINGTVVQDYGDAQFNIWSDNTLITMTSTRDAPYPGIFMNGGTLYWQATAVWYWEISNNYIGCAGCQIATENTDWRDGMVRWGSMRRNLLENGAWIDSERSTGGKNYDFVIEHNRFAGAVDVRVRNAGRIATRDNVVGVVGAHSHNFDIDRSCSAPPPATIFQYSYNGLIDGLNCINIFESLDAVTSNNYLCSNADLTGWQFATAGPVAGKRCSKWNEPADPDTWNDNFLCTPTSAIEVSFANVDQDPIVTNPSFNCISVNDPSQPPAQGWADNHFCWGAKPRGLLAAGNTLTGGQWLLSDEGRYRLEMQVDGNLVGYDTWISTISSQSNFFAAMTNGSPARLNLDDTGVLRVFRNSDNAVLWTSPNWVYSSPSSSYSFDLVMQTDRNVVTYKVSSADGSNLAAVWATMTNV
eukprot:TRINITY_DN5127_c0_g1_i2.p1 TRINITY_DN5127_c0_g1~~TRINITY_DN5127_c0_g1_i2.p1  ORF type:complete len:623 (-),score=111.70 TRINITY_DN5127_c0_g1_i2:37-1749(-)